MESNTNHAEVNNLFKWIEKTESILLCLLLTCLIVLSCLQIFLRTFWGAGLLWADPALRFLVIWCGLIGGVAATSKGKHIAIDLLSNRLPKKLHFWLELLTHLFCIVASAGLTWAACRFWFGEYQYPTPGPLNLPSWGWNAIYPLAFSFITLKYSLMFVLHLKKLFIATAPVVVGTGEQ